MRFTFAFLSFSVALLRQEHHCLFFAGAADPGRVVAVPCSEEAADNIDPAVNQLKCMTDPNTSFCKSLTPESLDLLPDTFVLVANCCGNDVIMGGRDEDLLKRRFLLTGEAGGGDSSNHHSVRRNLPAKKRTIEALIARYHSGDKEEGCELVPRCAENSNKRGGGVEYAIIIALRVEKPDDWEAEIKGKIEKYTEVCTAAAKKGGGGGISLWDVTDPKSCITQDVLVVADVNPLVNKCTR